MLVGVVGKPSSGKSTFFSAATLVDVPRAAYPFTTIDPNKGTAFVRSECPCKGLSKKCSPRNSKCVNEVRLIPVQLLDVAGLVPGAHKGKGLGNQFLGDLSKADALIHVVDCSGSSDFEGNPVEANSHYPGKDVVFLEQEIVYWIQGIIGKNLRKIAKSAEGGDDLKAVSALAEQLSGIGVNEEQVKKALKGLKKVRDWKEEELHEFSERIRACSKPILLALNKIDLNGAREFYESVRKEFNGVAVPVCAEAELALRRADEKGLIEYVPGSREFKELMELEEKQGKALEFVREKVLKEYGTTGLQEAVNKAVFELLEMIVVYPVEDQHKLSDSQGNVLPDAILLKKGSTALDLAYKIHTSIGSRFVSAIDCRTGKRLGKESVLDSGAIVKIQVQG